MTGRRKAKADTDDGGLYYDPPAAVEFIPSGCTLLDCVTGGGWPLGRISNIIGDRSSGKTLLAIEASANIARQFEDAEIRYAEGESAFDEEYAAALGMPLNRVRFNRSDGVEIDTVEAFYDDLSKFCKDTKHGGLYVLDSLDSLSDIEELKADMEKGSYGTQKAKQLSKLFRKLVREIGKANVHLMVISQIRDKIGVTFGRKWSRSGGHALDFYASQIVVLANTGTINREVKGVKRAIGVNILAKCIKNKLTMPFRECSFDVLFGYGIDDLAASVDWLAEVKRLDALKIKDDKKGSVAEFLRNTPDTPKERERIGAIVQKVWMDIESEFLPQRRKYE